MADPGVPGEAYDSGGIVSAAPRMGQIFETIFLGGLLMIMVIPITIFSIVLPFEIVRSLKRGVVYINDHPVRRSVYPIFFWPAWCGYIFIWILIVRLVLQMGWGFLDHALH